MLFNTIFCMTFNLFDKKYQSQSHWGAVYMAPYQTGLVNVYSATYDALSKGTASDPNRSERAIRTLMTHLRHRSTLLSPSLAIADDMMVPFRSCRLTSFSREKRLINGAAKAYPLLHAQVSDHIALYCLDGVRGSRQGGRYTSACTARHGQRDRRSVAGQYDLGPARSLLCPPGRSSPRQ